MDNSANCTKLSATAIPSVYSYIADRDGLSRALDVLRQAPVLALDVETARGVNEPAGDPNRTGLDPHRGRLRLLTLATSDHAYIIDTWRCPGWLDAAGTLLSPVRTILGHNLVFDLGFLLANETECDATCHDTMLAARLIDGGKHFADRTYSFSLKAVARRALGLDLDKTLQVSDWSLPELSEEQLAYAASDVLTLHPLYVRQQAEVRGVGPSPRGCRRNGLLAGRGLAHVHRDAVRL